MSELSPVRVAKLGHRFRSLDRDGDGVITADDFGHLVDRYTWLYNLDAKHPHAEALRDVLDKLWMAAGPAVGILSDGEMEAGDFLDTYGHPDALPSLIGCARAWFDAVDLDGNGFWRPVDLAFFYWVNGQRDLGLADRVFRALTGDSRGRLSGEEWEQAVEQFWTSDDPTDVGTYVYGAPSGLAMVL